MLMRAITPQISNANAMLMVLKACLIERALCLQALSLPAGVEST